MEIPIEELRKKVLEGLIVAANIVHRQYPKVDYLSTAVMQVGELEIAKAFGFTVYSDSWRIGVENIRPRMAAKHTEGFPAIAIALDEVK